MTIMAVAAAITTQQRFVRRARISGFIIAGTRRTGRKSNTQRRAAIMAAQTKITIGSQPLASIIRIRQ
jgi:hypothetical protein